MKYPKTYNNPVSIANRKMGKKNEDIVLPLLKTFFNAKFDNNEDRNKWEVIDFVDEEDKLCIENKSRNITHNQYDTIMISYKKYPGEYKASKELMRKGYKGFFSFYFEPEKRLFLYELKDKIEEDIEIRRGGTDKRGYNEYTKCLYIPTKYLFDIEDFYSYQDYKNKQEGLTYL